MSEEQLKAFLEAVKSDVGLQVKLKAAADAEDVVAIAKDAGFGVSVEDLQRSQIALSEYELEGVAGGGCGCIASAIHSVNEFETMDPNNRNVCPRPW